MVPVLEAVPNFSEGRDLDLVRRIVSRIEEEGADVLDWSADPDHNRSVVTFVGDPVTVERAAVSATRVAVEHIDLRDHRGVHPRIGAVDVLPFVPLHGTTLAEAAAVARRAGSQIAGLGVPVYWYGEVGPPGRTLADLRRGGFEALVAGGDAARRPDLPAGRDGRLHPTAGATCVGARGLLLAWNVYVDGIDMEGLRRIASALRERPPRRGSAEPDGRDPEPGRFVGLRALAFELESSGRRQISMNLEDVESTSPFAVFSALEARVRRNGGQITGTEVIGMIPAALVLPAASDRLRLLDSHPSRLLPARLVDHVSRRSSGP